MTASLPIATRTLGELLEGVDLVGPLDQALDQAMAALPVRSAEYDSRKATEGTVFFAFAGAKADGAMYADDARRRGSAVTISESARPAGFDGPWVRVQHGRRALGVVSRRLHKGAASITAAGCTGTNGKTTTATLIDAAHLESGRRTVFIGTTGYRIAGVARDGANTTPESLDTNRMFEEGAEAGATHATMEVSSHALELGRVWAIPFHAAVFTNLTRDHLDFHPDMEAYFRAKCALFAGQGTPPPRWAILNHDDEWARRIPVPSETQVIWYGRGAGAGLRAEGVKADIGGIRFTVAFDGRKFEAAARLTGMFNVSNILAAFGAAWTMGVEPETILRAIERRGVVPGRFERVDEGQPFLVVVDYAHTDDALRNVITAARAVTKGRVITLFGCGGDRDRAKRPRMGQAVGELSDYVVLTSDNPRSEDPLDIINDALVGLSRTSARHDLIPDRAQAIRAAIREARPGDVVILAGKGHETYQVLGGGAIHFDDREQARAALREIGFQGRAR